MTYGIDNSKIHVMDLFAILLQNYFSVINLINTFSMQVVLISILSYLHRTERTFIYNTKSKNKSRSLFCYA